MIIGLDGDELNLSPLRGQAGARFVSSADEMAAVLQAIGVEEATPMASARNFLPRHGIRGGGDCWPREPVDGSRAGRNGGRG